MTLTADSDLSNLLAFLERVPAVKSDATAGWAEDGRWWVKFTIDIDHNLAWRVVQELGHVVNYISLNDRLPIVFKPVSPPPYMNGGPEDFLSWVIESEEKSFTPAACTEWLEGRLPQPVQELTAWDLEEE